MARTPLPHTEKKVNVPNWCLKSRTIEAVKLTAKHKNISESALLEDALSQYFMPSKEMVKR